MDRTANQEHDERSALAAAIERRTQDIVDRWLEHVRSEAGGRDVALTDLRDGINDYLHRLVELLQGGTSLTGIGSAAWSDVARAHALTRVRLGFDVSQLFRELIALRRVTVEILREEGLLADGSQAQRIAELNDAALSESIRSYVEFRDYEARRQEAEHIGFLTHELRNPLGVVSMAAAQLRNSELPDAERRRLHDILDRSIDRLRKMIDDVLLTERLQIGEVESRPIDTTFGQLLGNSLDYLQRTANQKGLKLSVTFDPDLVVRTDPTLTMSALENLLDNAIKYTDSGEVTLQVEDQPEEIVVHVRDQCGGLSPQELGVIFEPFRRVHSSKRGGSGLGLAIARRAVEAQGGSIHAESSTETGCHFWFNLPKTHH